MRLLMSSLWMHDVPVNRIVPKSGKIDSFDEVTSGGHEKTVQEGRDCQSSDEDRQTCGDELHLTFRHVNG